MQTVLIFGDIPYSEKTRNLLLKRGIRTVFAAKRRDGTDFSPRDHLAYTRLISAKGQIGDFLVTMQDSKKRFSIHADYIVVAVRPRFIPDWQHFGLKDPEKIFSLSDFDNKLDPEAINSGPVAIINGVLNESHPVFARKAMNLALDLAPVTRVYYFTRNLKVAGAGLEMLYDKTKQAGVVYVKLTDSGFNVEADKDGGFTIACRDEIARADCRLKVSSMVFDDALITGDEFEELARALRIDRGSLGFLQSGNVHRLNPFTNRRGVFVASWAKKILSDEEEAADFAEALTAILTEGREKRDPGRAPAEIEKGKCVRCLTCYRVCPHSAVELNARPVVLAEACEGCGICAAECPREAIDTNAGRPPVENGIKAVVFACSRSAVGALRLHEKVSGKKIAEHIKIIEVPCAGSISTREILSALETGAAGVLIMACHMGNCFSEKGNLLARKRVELLQGIAKKINVDPERIDFQTISSNMGAEFFERLSEFLARIDPES